MSNKYLTKDSQPQVDTKLRNLSILLVIKCLGNVTYLICDFPNTNARIHTKKVKTPACSHFSDWYHSK